MKTNVNGQSGVEKTTVLPRSIANCLKDIEKGRAAITALQDALECHVYDLPCKKKGRQHGIYQGLGDVDRAVLDKTIADLARFRHSIRVTEDRLYSFGERRSPSSPAERGRKRFAGWSQKFGPAAEAAIEMAEEIEAAKHGERSTRAKVLTPDDLAAVTAETLADAVANLEDLATQVNEALAVTENLQEEREEAVTAAADVAAG
jgi:hypothetical protein